MLSKLLAKNLLLESNHEPLGYVPAKSLDVLMLADVIDAVRCAEEANFLAADAVILSGSARESANNIDGAIRQALKG